MTLCYGPNAGRKHGVREKEVSFRIIRDQSALGGSPEYSSYFVYTAT
jgi:hypothetical protein